jgi:hypothetical protein
VVHQGFRAAAGIGDARIVSNGAGFYEPNYSVEEIADLVAHATDEGLEDEIAAVRVATHKVMENLQGEMAPGDFSKLTRLVFTGANTIARLLYTQRELHGESADGIARAISQALDELSGEFGVEL